MRLLIILVLTLFLQSCSGSKVIQCSDFFESCKKKSVIDNCEAFVADTTITFLDKSMNFYSGPLKLEEIDAFKNSELSNQEFNSKSVDADSFWWFSKWNGESGSEGVVAIKDCSILSELNLKYYIGE